MVEAKIERLNGPDGPIVLATNFRKKGTLESWEQVYEQWKELLQQRARGLEVHDTRQETIKSK